MREWDQGEGAAVQARQLHRVTLHGPAQGEGVGRGAGSGSKAVGRVEGKGVRAQRFRLQQETMP